MEGRVFQGRYRAIRLLGEGAMGRVYLAHQLGDGRPVVVKVLHQHLARDPKFRDSFQREMLCLARFQHPYAVALYDAVLHDPDGPYLVMEYLPGLTLEALLERQGPLRPQRVGRLLGQLCQVLGAAHAHGIIHRDLKPANLMVVGADSPSETLKVMDFGLARLGAALYIPLEKLTSPNPSFFACGTPEYICPEQLRGDDIDHRGDLYSVGVILFEMLTGRRPFYGATPAALFAAHRHAPPPRFADLGAGAGVPPDVEEVVQACLAKYPVERPQSAQELAARFAQALGQEFAEPPPEAVPPAPAPVVCDAEPGELDANATVHRLEAWMPERIAVVKLRGFVDDVGGEVVESIPGLIRIRLGPRGDTPPPAGSRLLSRLGLGRKPEPPPPDPIDLELYLKKKDLRQGHQLEVTVQLRPLDGRPRTADPDWQVRCDRIVRDLRAYLIGSQ
jgi:serine/threonine-protein kinase